MIVHKKWHKFRHNSPWNRVDYEGWFLFGFIPLYIDRQRPGDKKEG